MNPIAWIALPGLLLACAWWYHRENKRLAHRLRLDLDERSARWMIRFTWSRTIQTLLIIAACATIIGVYDWQLSKARGELKLRKTELADVKRALTTATAAAPPSTAARPSAPPDYYPPATTAESALDIIDGEAPAEPVHIIGADDTALSGIIDPDEKESELDAVYNPERTNPGKQAAMDDIKKRYEEIIVTYFFLQKCDKASQSDYYIILSGLVQEMASINAPSRLQVDTLTAASGSYQEVYSKSRCNAEGIDALQTQYQDYLRVLQQNYPPPAR